ncbi:MAG: hypothetical protein HC906_19660 [Bacteroidales bacterium]|nr:hypothetical protein [Bacteroidales bacterium]
MFREADLVKFAKADPLPDENEIQLEKAYIFVDHTKFQVVEPSIDIQVEPVNEKVTA